MLYQRTNSKQDKNKLKHHFDDLKCVNVLYQRNNPIICMSLLILCEILFYLMLTLFNNLIQIIIGYLYQNMRKSMLLKLF